MGKNKQIPFPQADDMSKIFKIINIDNSDDLKNTASMQIVLGDISSRQVQYYLDAAAFLSIIDEKKEFTSFGINLRKLNTYEQKILVAQKIVSNDVFGEVYFSELILGVKLEKEEIVSLMKNKVKFNSNEIYNRRAQTVLKWVEWINLNDERFKV